MTTDGIPRGSVSRTARLASLPLGAAGRATLGIGKRLSGQSGRRRSTAELQQRTAEQLFAVLGQLKGGAMKLGQTLSVFEAAVPEEIAGPYREALVKLQEAAPPMPVRTVHAVLAQQLGGAVARAVPRLRRHRRRPRRASARCTGPPGATAATSRSRSSTPAPATALMADLNQLARFARLFAALFPGMEVKPLIAELKARVESRSSTTGSRPTPSAAFAAAYAGDDQIVVPAGGGQRAQGDRLRVARGHPAVADHRRRHRGASATAPAC